MGESAASGLATGHHPEAEILLTSFYTKFNKLPAGSRDHCASRLLCSISEYFMTREDNTERMKKRMHEEIEAQCAAVYRQKITDLEEGLQRSEQKVTELAMKNKQIAQDLDRERNHKIIIGTMAGVIPNTAQREERDDMINVYFADSLPSFVNDFSLPKVEVCAMEEKLIELLATTFKQGRDALVHCIVDFCERNCDPNAAEPYKAVAQQGGGHTLFLITTPFGVKQITRELINICKEGIINPLDLMKKFLSGEVYANASQQSLGAADRYLRKAIIFIKSVFFQTTQQTGFSEMMEWVVCSNDNFGFLLQDDHTEKISKPAVERFLKATASVLYQMLKSESPIIPWTGPEMYDPMYVKVDGHQQSCEMEALTDDDLRGYKIAGYKHPILLSCSHNRVKIEKGIVRLLPDQEAIEWEINSL